MDESTVMNLACEAGFGEQQRITLKSKLLRFANLVADEMAGANCPKCGQNTWMAADESEDKEMTVCANCGWDTEAEGYIEGCG